MEIVSGANPAPARSTRGNSSPLTKNSSGSLRKDSRSAVTNGKRLHVVPPGDGAWARRFRDVLTEILAEVAASNDAAIVPEWKKQQARRCATLIIACEKLEGEVAAGHDVDLKLYGMLADRLGRAFARLGLKHKRRDEAGPGLLGQAWRDEPRQRHVNSTHDEQTRNK